MMKITLYINKHDGNRLSLLEDREDEKEENQFEQTKRQKENKDSNLAIPRNDELTEERMTVTKANWLGRRERSHPKKDRPLVPGGNNEVARKT